MKNQILPLLIAALLTLNCSAQENIVTLLNNNSYHMTEILIKGPRPTVEALLKEGLDLRVIIFDKFSRARLFKCASSNRKELLSKYGLQLHYSDVYYDNSYNALHVKNEAKIKAREYANMLIDESKENLNEELNDYLNIDLINKNKKQLKHVHRKASKKRIKWLMKEHGLKKKPLSFFEQFIKLFSNKNKKELS